MILCWRISSSTLLLTRWNLWFGLLGDGHGNCSSIWFPMNFGSQVVSSGPFRFFMASLRPLAWIWYSYLSSNGGDRSPFGPWSYSWSCGSEASSSFSCCSCGLSAIRLSLIVCTGFGAGRQLSETQGPPRGRSSDRQSCPFRAAGTPRSASFTAVRPPRSWCSLGNCWLGTATRFPDLGSSSMGPSMLRASSAPGSCWAESVPDPVLALSESS